MVSLLRRSSVRLAVAVAIGRWALRWRWLALEVAEGVIIQWPRVGGGPLDAASIYVCMYVYIDIYIFAMAMDSLRACDLDGSVSCKYELHAVRWKVLHLTFLLAQHGMAPGVSVLGLEMPAQEPLRPEAPGPANNPVSRLASTSAD